MQTSLKWAALAALLASSVALAQEPPDGGGADAGAPGPFALPPSVLAGPQGFGLKSDDGAYRLLFHWALLSDFQIFPAQLPAGVTTRDSFVVRFAGMQVDAIIHQRLHSQLFVDFSQSKVTLYDAWVEALVFPELRVRAGKFLFPISEERLTPGIALPFVSTSFATLLLPSRDTGVQVYGNVGEGLFQYNLAFTNGGPAGTLSDFDLDSEKDVVARVFVRPFLRTGLRPLRGLGLGVGASYGAHTGTPEAPGLSVLRTYGGQTFFSWANDKTPAGTATASGAILRVVPHATWAFGPVAAYADWVHVEEHVRGAVITSDAYSVVPSVVLTGEAAAPLSYIVPKRPLDLHGGIGTVLLVLGLGRMQVRDSAFLTGNADPRVAAQTATVYGGGLNWYPVSGLALLASYGHMVFTAYGGAPPRANEDTLIVRFQMVL